MKNWLYAPPPLAGIFDADPEPVEILEIDYESGNAKIKIAIEPNALINVLRPKRSKPITEVTRVVPIDHLISPEAS